MCSTFGKNYSSKKLRRHAKNSIVIVTSARHFLRSKSSFGLKFPYQTNILKQPLSACNVKDLNPHPNRLQTYSGPILLNNETLERHWKSSYYSSLQVKRSDRNELRKNNSLEKIIKEISLKRDELKKELNRVKKANYRLRRKLKQTRNESYNKFVKKISTKLFPYLKKFGDCYSRNSGRGKRGRRYTNLEKQMALELFNSDKILYKLISQIIILPDKKTLNICRSKKCTT